MAERCQRIEPLLSAHHDGELDDAEARVVRGHLAACDRCTRASEALLSVRTLVRSMPVRRLPADLALPGPGVGPAPSARTPGAPRSLSRAGAALAVAGGLLTGAAFSLGGQPAQGTPTVSVPMDVYVADHVVHTVNRAVFTPIRLESQR